MKALKIIGKIFKWYGLITMSIWAFVGIGNLLEKFKAKPKLGPLEADAEVIEESCKKYKKWFKSLF